ncbi:MAG TPA: outer membrane beta-barrel protein [Chthoniobacterales bacterium]|nr:outer membrane beta-barrel protein [Chthoniobacterales bacterium]
MRKKPRTEMDASLSQVVARISRLAAGDRAMFWVLMISAAILSQPIALAEEPTVEIVTQQSAPAGEETALNSGRPVPRFQISTEFHGGYDDNFNTSQGNTSQGRGGAWFTEEQLTLSYHSPNPDTLLNAVAGVGATTYFGERTDTKAFLDLELSHPMTRRLTLNASLDARYQVEPDLVSNTGPTNRRGSFYSIDYRMWAEYELTRRLSSVSSYNFRLIRYENDATALFTDREEHTLGEQIRFTLTSTTVLTGEYRLLLVDYVTAALDSTTHFFLGGLEHRFNSRLRAQARGGASIRSFDFGESQTNPDFEGSMEYMLGSRTSVSWTGSYSVEQPQQQGVISQKAFRTGLRLSHDFTRRINGSLALNYNHEREQQGTTLVSAGPTFDQDVFSLSLRAQYQLSSRLAFDARYEHSEVSSGRTLSDYTRNRYSAGFNFTF